MASSTLLDAIRVPSTVREAGIEELVVKTARAMARRWPPTYAEHEQLYKAFDAGIMNVNTPFRALTDPIAYEIIKRCDYALLSRLFRCVAPYFDDPTGPSLHEALVCLVERPGRPNPPTDVILKSAARLMGMRTFSPRWTEQLFSPEGFAGRMHVSWRIIVFLVAQLLIIPLAARAVTAALRIWLPDMAPQVPLRGLVLTHSFKFRAAGLIGAERARELYPHVASVTPIPSVDFAALVHKHHVEKDDHALVL